MGDLGFLIFLAGLMTGGAVGVTVMALLTAARSTDDRRREERTEH